MTSLTIRNCHKKIPLHFVFNSLVAVICLFWLLTIPADPKNSVFAGLSASRLAMAAFLLAIIFLSSVLSYNSGRLTPWMKKIADFVFARPARWKISFVATLVSMMMILPGLFLDPLLFDAYQYVIVRLRPILAWLAITLVQIVFLIGWGWLLRHPEWSLQLREDFRGSEKIALNWKHVLIFLPVVAFAGIALGLLLSRTTVLFSSGFFFIPLIAILSGVVLLLSGIFYNRSMVRFSIITVVILFIMGAVLNLSRFPVENLRYAATIHRLPAPDAVSLGQKHHYSLSIYHILSILYPDSRLAAASGILEDWNLQTNRLLVWVPLQAVDMCEYDAVVTNEEAQKIKSLNPIEVEINTVTGFVYYQLVPLSGSNTNQILLAYYERQRFILPVTVFEELLDRSVKCPF